MSIRYSGTFRRSAGIVSAIGKQLKLVNLKGVQKITFTFDPFVSSVASARDFLFQLTTPKITQTNIKCAVKTDIVCDRRPSEVKLVLTPEAQEKIQTKEIKFLSDNLSLLELLQLFNQHISVLAPKEDAINIVQTKSEKKSVASKRKVGKKK